MKRIKLRAAIATNIILLTQLVDEGRIRRLPGGFYAAWGLREPAAPMVAREVIAGSPGGRANVGALGAADLSWQVLANLVEQGLLLTNKRLSVYWLPPKVAVPAPDSVAAVHAVFQQRPKGSANTVPLYRLLDADPDREAVKRLVCEGVLWCRRVDLRPGPE